MIVALRPLLAAAAVFLPTAAFAHFQQILPSADILRKPATAPSPSTSSSPIRSRAGR